MTVLSVDLVDSREYGDVGVVALRTSDSAIGVAPIGLQSVGLEGEPEVEDLATFLVSLAEELNASCILIDGPQGWKAPDDGLEHSRRCEHELSTHLRTGLPGTTQPLEKQGFAEFCVQLFDELSTLMYPRLSTTGDWPTRVSVESCPTSAWHSLGIAALPSALEASSEDVHEQVKALQSCFPLDLRGVLSAAEVQAAVAGMAGVALERRNLAGLAFAGVEPMLVDGSWREGYILNPTREAAYPPV